MALFPPIEPYDHGMLDVGGGFPSAYPGMTPPPMDLPMVTMSGSSSHWPVAPP